MVGVVVANLNDDAAARGLYRMQLMVLAVIIARTRGDA